MKATSRRQKAGSGFLNLELRKFAVPTVRVGRTGVTKVMAPTGKRP